MFSVGKEVENQLGAIGVVWGFLCAVSSGCSERPQFSAIFVLYDVSISILLSDDRMIGTLLINTVWSNASVVVNKLHLSIIYFA